jgi:hypothetical protein
LLEHWIIIISCFCSLLKGHSHANDFEFFTF